MSKPSTNAGALAVGLISAAVAGCASMAPSLPPAPPQIVVDGERVFPESMTSAADGSVYFGSIGNKMIYRAAPGSDKAVAFVQPADNRLLRTDLVPTVGPLVADCSLWEQRHYNSLATSFPLTLSPLTCGPA